MSQCSFFLDNLVCLDSDHAVAYPRLKGSCFRGTPGQDMHSRYNKRDGNERKGGGSSVRLKQQGDGGDRLKAGGVKGTEVSAL